MKFKHVGIIVGLALWVWAIVLDSGIGVVQAMLLIVIMYLINIDSELSKMKKEKDEVPK